MLKSLYDSHLHLFGIGYIHSQIDLSHYMSIKDMGSIKINKQIILGRGWHQSQFKENRYPTKHDLNKISNSKPVIFTRVCGHVLVCNDKAMELASITKNTPQVEGGSFDIDTGIFTEDALHLIYSIIPKPTQEDIKKYFIKGNKILLSNGITSCASDDFSTQNVPYELIIECLEELYNEGLMQVRLYEQVNLPSKELLQDFIDKGYHKKKFNGFRMGPLKLLADGSLGGHTALLRHPYSDKPSDKGIQVFSRHDLEEMIYLADSNGMDVAIHAIGDGMIDQVIDAIYYSISRTNRTHHRHSIIHAQLANKSQIKRMRGLGISSIVQPIFLNSDIPIIEERLGKERASESYLFKTMFEEGINVGFSTDAPVEPVNPFLNIYTAMTRTSIKYPHLGAFLPSEAFSLEESLKCYTENNYWLSYDEHNDFNDYIIIDKDINTCTVEELKDIKVLQTYINGKLVYENN